jgi:hypothetical protein
MTLSATSWKIGRHLFGVAAFAFGVITLVWPNYKDWDQLRSILNATDGPAFLYAVAAAQIFGGAAIQFRRTAKTGAVILGVVYLVFALLCVPGIVATPQVYNSWGNFFEPFSLVTGAAIVYARLSSVWSAATLNRFSRVLFGVCAASFTLEQAFYLKATAKFVPAWIPPSQMFWAVATTVLLGLGALALLTNRMALLAIRLLTLMLVMFGLLVWIPLLLSNPNSHGNWSEFIETLAIAGAAWILADLLGENRPNDHLPR